MFEKLYKHIDKAHKLGIHQGMHVKVLKVLQYMKLISDTPNNDASSINNNQLLTITQNKDTTSNKEDDSKHKSKIAMQGKCTSSNLTYFHNNLKAKARCMSTTNLLTKKSSSEMLQGSPELQKQNSLEGSQFNKNKNIEVMREQKRLQRSKQIREKRKKSIYNFESLQIVKESETEDVQFESDSATMTRTSTWDSKKKVNLLFE